MPRKQFLRHMKYFFKKYMYLNPTLFKVTLPIFNAHPLELVSKELNHFGRIVLFFQDWAPGTLTGGAWIKIYSPPVSVIGAQSRKNDAIPPK